VLVDNYLFFRNTLEVYPLQYDNIGFLLSLAILLVTLTALMLFVVSSKYTTKPIVILVLLLSSLGSYFMNSYQVVIDHGMIRNMLQTNLAESMDLLSIKLVLYFVFLGIVPSLWVYRVDIRYAGLRVEALSKLKGIIIATLVIVVSVLSFSKHYTSFFREHKPLRYSTNPSYWIYSIGKYINLTLSSTKLAIRPIGLDAKIARVDTNRTIRPKLVIMVVGEAVRADHLSINGYHRETTPLLAQENIINFPNFYSCGTSTAVSVPCMFSIYTRGQFSYKKGITTQSVLDVLSHTTEIDILWRDNNSDSKGVALRVPYQSYMRPSTNTICDSTECRDEGMLVGLDEYILEHKGRDILILLHQMGNHGPAYYKRYPKEFEKFTPTCNTNQLEQCSSDEISNTYDNAITYTDYFLSKSIDMLKEYSKTHDTAMVYMSDHGESLGEGGLYLHGMPYFMAPDAQTHVPTFIWFGDGSYEHVDMSSIRAHRAKRLTQDSLFHTLLGLFEVRTKLYNPELDLLHI